MGMLCVDPLEDLDRVAGAELDDRLLPAGLVPALQTAALRLRLHLGDVHAQHLDVEELLDRLPDLGLVRIRMDSERVGVAALDLRVALLRYDRREQHLVGMKTHLTASFVGTSRFPQAPATGPLTRTGGFAAGCKLMTPSPGRAQAHPG